MRKDTKDLDRVFHAVYAIYFLRYWRQHLADNKIKREHFITQTSFEGLEMNLVLLVKLIEIGKIHLLWEISTQNNENFFRTIRSFSPMESMMATCSLKGFMSKVHRIQIEKKLIKEIEEKFDWKKNESSENPQNEIYSIEDIDNEIKKAIQKAQCEAKSLRIQSNSFDLNKFISKVDFEITLTENDTFNDDFLDIDNDCINLSALEENDNVENIENIIVKDIELLNDYSCEY